MIIDKSADGNPIVRFSFENDVVVSVAWRGPGVASLISYPKGSQGVASNHVGEQEACDEEIVQYLAERSGLYEDLQNAKRLLALAELSNHALQNKLRAVSERSSKRLRRIQTSNKTIDELRKALNKEGHNHVRSRIQSCPCGNIAGDCDD
jgi:hypothetical protein